MAIINLEGMEFFAFHGCFKEERIIGNRFLVNVSFETDTKFAEETDDLSKTINYQHIYKLVKKEMEITSKLLENVCRRIVDIIFENYPFITNLKVKVSKIHPSLGGKMDNVSITIIK
jgi:7,8-dihydroneopterin aldolase/epimerase/oxygenase